jgi:hypothetical protein
MFMTAVKLRIVCNLTECFLGDQSMEVGFGGTYSTDDEMTIAYFVL